MKMSVGRGIKWSKSGVLRQEHKSLFAELETILLPEYLLPPSALAVTPTRLECQAVSKPPAHNGVIKLRSVSRIRDQVLPCTDVVFLLF
jgi:hypothetical protein